MGGLTTRNLSDPQMFSKKPTKKKSPRPIRAAGEEREALLPEGPQV